VQGLTAPDRIAARETHFARDFDIFLFVPLRQFFDIQKVVGLKRQIRITIAPHNSSEIDIQKLSLAVFAVDHFVAHQLSLSSIGSLVEAAARPNEVAHVHAGFKGIRARHLHASARRDDLQRLIDLGLSLQLLDERRGHAVAPTDEIEHRDAVAGCERNVGIGNRARRARGRDRLR